MDNQPKSEARLFSSFVLNPDICFQSQQPDEKVVLLLRAHPITQISWIVNSLFFFLLISFLNLFVQNWFPVIYRFYLNFFLFSILISYVIINITNWYFNIGIITDKRIVDLDYTPLTYRHFTEVQLFNVEEPSYHAAGIFSALFNYGTVQIQTASAVSNLEFHNVPYPAEVVKIINKLMGKLDDND